METSQKTNPWNAITGIKAKRVFDIKDCKCEKCFPGPHKPDFVPDEECQHEKWVKFRNKGIGGSDISAIVGVNPFKCAIDVYLEKTGKTTVEPNEKMKWGNILEEPVAREFSRKVGVKINRVKAVLQDVETPYFLANLDRLIIRNGYKLDPENNITHRFLLNQGNGILEVKTTGWAQAWDGDDIPPMAETQLQWYMGITGLKFAQFAVLISGQTFKVTKILMFDEKMFDSMKRIAKGFWLNNIQKDIPPLPGSNPASYDAVKKLYGEKSEDTSCILNEEFNELITERQKFKKLESDSKKARSIIDGKILFAMENNKTGLTSEWNVSRISFEKPGFDTKSFKEANMDLYDKYQKSSMVIYPKYKKIDK